MNHPVPVLRGHHSFPKEGKFWILSFLFSPPFQRRSTPTFVSGGGGYILLNSPDRSWVQQIVHAFYLSCFFDLRYLVLKSSVVCRPLNIPYNTQGNRIFGIARPTPSNVSFDEKGRQNLLWISSKLGERDEAIQVKYYSQSAPLLFLGAIIALLIGVILVLFFYSRSKRELESVKGIFELEKEYEKKQRRRK